MSTLYLDCTHGSRKDTFAVGVGLLLKPEERVRIAQDTGAAKTEAECCCDSDHDHDHHSISEVHEKIDGKGISDAAKEAAHGVYEILRAAEAKAHGVTLDEVHFHEVGSDEAITWVCIACASVVSLGVDRIVSSPICTGFGYVDCAHGTLPIPAPATAHALEGIPTFAGDEEGELTTPTGAALVRFFASEFAEKAPIDADLVAEVG